MEAQGRRCVLHLYPDQKHGFFNYWQEGQKYYRETLIDMDRFLESLGYLEGEPTVQE